MPEISVVIPVLNERDNIRPLVEALRQHLSGLSWEAVFVDDDSPDGTAEVCRAFAAEDPRIRVLQRIGRRGLASACVEGMMGSSAPWLAVMDGDLQHDVSVLSQMLGVAKTGSFDLVVGSRHVAGGSMGAFSARRVRLSNLGRRLSAVILKAPLTDPMSGFFVVSRSYVAEVVHDLSTFGFKILLDLIASSRRPVKVAEVPFTFGVREHGTSKLDTTVGLDFLLLIADKLFGEVLPVRFGLYALVGLTGIGAHFAVLTLLHVANPALSIVWAQLVATLVAIVWNFFVNNEITFRDRKLRGWRALCRGLFWYTLACSAGAFVNLGITSFLAGAGIAWYVAGAAGMSVSAVWNYVAANLLAWKIERRRRVRARFSSTAGHAAAAAGSHVQL